MLWLRVYWLAACLGVGLFGSWAGAAEPASLVTATGTPEQAMLVAAAGDWKLQFAAGETRREVAGADLVSWGRFVDPKFATSIVLASGGLIAAEDMRIEKEELLATSEVFGPIRLPLELVAGMILRTPPGPNAADRLVARMLAPVGTADRLLMDNGDELSGTILGLGSEAVSLEADGQPVEMKTDHVAGIIFNPTLLARTRPSGLRAWVGLRDGSRVLAVQLSASGDAAILTLPGGAELKAPLEEIVALLMLGGRAMYLSDLKPSGYRHIPYLDLSWTYMNDANVTGARLRADGRLYLKGLGMHSPSRISYDLDAAYRRFEADVAIDASAGRRGSVVFRVFVDDGSGKWSEKASTEIVRGGEPPRAISVDLSGIKRISLLVDHADRGDEQDRADWLNARLIK